MYNTGDTITALATPPMPSAVAVIRISGPKTPEILSAIFRPRAKSKTAGARTMRAGDIIDPRTGKTVDETLAVFFKGPSSYTGEDSAEIHCHGNPFIAAKILDVISSFEGARVAQRGEFTYRAFLNGKIDLAQAEAVLSVIESKTDFALGAGINHLKGKLSRETGEWKKSLVDILATVEAVLDYPEDTEENPGWADETADKIIALKNGMEKALETSVIAPSAEILTVITGRPNVGKSSLFNAMAREELSIVTPLAGTTTDVVSETLHWNSMLWKICDTAGISGDRPSGPVEEIGRRRAADRLENAEAVIAVFDGAAPLLDDDRAIARRAAATSGRAAAVAAVNKCDLAAAFGDDELRALFGGGEAAPEIVRVSAAAGEGIDKIKSSLARQITTGRGAAPDAEAAVVANARQKKAVERAVGALQKAAELLKEREREELAAHQLALAATALREMLGEITPDDVLADIFSRFCVGK